MTRPGRAEQHSDTRMYIFVQRLVAHFSPGIGKLLSIGDWGYRNSHNQMYSASQQTVTISRMAVNVFNWCCWAVMLAVIVDAQPTVDETVTCSTSTFEEVANNMVKLIATNQQAEEIKDETRNVKQLLESRPVECDAWSPSKQALVSALVCEYLLCFCFHDNIYCITYCAIKYAYSVKAHRL